MSKTVKIVLVSIFSVLLILGLGFAGLSYIIYTTAQNNSCYVLKLNKTSQVKKYDVNTFAKYFNSEGKIVLNSSNNQDYFGENLENKVKVEANKNQVIVKATQPLGWNQPAKEFLAEQLGVAFGSVVGQDVASEEEIVGVAQKIGVAFEAMQPYSESFKGWDVNFTSSCK